MHWFLVILAAGFAAAFADIPLTDDLQKDAENKLPLTSSDYLKIVFGRKPGMVDDKSVIGENEQRSGDVYGFGECALPIDPGPCHGYFPRYAYDSRLGRCIPYIYGGCQGNRNNFESPLECQKMCSGSLTFSQFDDTTRGDEVSQSAPQCIQPIDPGPCYGYFPRYAYDIRLGRCVQFIYGGCQGNMNNFEDPLECQHMCIESLTAFSPFDDATKGDEVSQSAPQCVQPIDAGPCRAYIPRWGYDINQGRCRQFIYGGCAGNINNFKTLEECRAVCSKWLAFSTTEGQAKGDEVSRKAPQCLQPIVVGPCKGAIPRWAFDINQGKCRIFYYGGCQGNRNNFQSLQECQTVCNSRSLAFSTAEDHAKEDEVAHHALQCTLPIYAGPCMAYMPRWGYDGHRCIPFIYGGCSGNPNNFQSLEECQAECSRRLSVIAPTQSNTAEDYVVGLFGLNEAVVPFALDGNPTEDEVVSVLEQRGLNEAATIARRVNFGQIIHDSQLASLTIFVPTNEAIKRWKEIVAECPENVEILTKAVKASIVPNKALKSIDFENDLKLATLLENVQLRINVYSNGKVTINGVPIKAVDNDKSIHVIDGVIWPLPDGNLMDELERAGHFSKLIALIQTAGLQDYIAKTDALTCFAPTDKALATISRDKMAELLSDINKLQHLLKYHLIPKTYYSAGLLDKQHMVSLAGEIIDLGYDAQKDVIQLNLDPAHPDLASRVSIRDIPANNGVIHVIDRILDIPRKPKA